MRLLVVEDEKRLAELVRQGLVDEGHPVEVVHSSEDALDFIAVTEFDAIILDVMLPGMSGLELCRKLRAARNQTPILLLTARDAVEDRVAGLDAGADDYLVKPFAFAELSARLRALSRRPPEALDPVLRVGDLTLDPASRQVTRGDDKFRPAQQAIPDSRGADAPSGTSADQGDDHRPRLGLRCTKQSQCYRRPHSRTAAHARRSF